MLPLVELTNTTTCSSDSMDSSILNLQNISSHAYDPLKGFRSSWGQGVLESPPNFCNGLRTIYLMSSQGRTFDLTTRDMGSKFRYVLGKVLGTQDRPTLRLASHHYVLRLNLIKNMFNTCIYTHTHTSIHLSIQHGIIILKHIPIYL